MRVMRVKLRSVMEDTNLEKDIILDGFYPLAILGRFLGCFSFTNIGQAKRTSDLRIKRFTLTIFMTVLGLCFSFFRLVRILSGYDLTNDLGFTDLLLYALVSIYQIFGGILLIQLNSKTRALLALFYLWNRVEPLLNDRRRVKLFGYLCFFSFIFLIGSYSQLFLTYFSGRPLNFDNFVHSYALINATALTLYVGAFVVYFNKTLQCCFVALNQELDSVLSSPSFCPSNQLIRIRQRHEILLSISYQLNSILSPILFFYVVIQSASSCITSYETLDSVLFKNQSVLISLRPVFIGLIRFIPVAALCLSSNLLTQKATSGIRYLSRHPLGQLTPETKFQVEMLRFQMNRKPVLSANGFFIIDNRLLGEILGVMATYVVIMLEISQEKSKEK